MTHDETRARILIVDDNEANRALARSTLEDEGYDVTVAIDGAGALAELERASHDCVLLDVRMPSMDGFEVCRRVRAMPACADVPVVFLTALRDVETFDHALEAGGDDFLSKPVRPAELVIRVQAALKLRRLRAEAREQVELLRKQRDDLMRVQLQKERLTAFVVHDLKNPVNAMDLYAQLLQRESSSPATKEAAAHIRGAAQQLTRMIHNLLDISKADEGKLGAKRAPLELGGLVSGVLSDLALSAQDREISLRSDIGAPTVDADADLLKRLLANLVENAIRHSPARGEVTVETRAVVDGVELRIADRGPGVPTDLKERVFDPFVQLDRHDARGGRGLGLTFCKLAAEAHDGSIRVEDGSPGAVFVVRIPRPRPGEP
jgi:signal transduction histidine kinase